MGAFDWLLPNQMTQPLGFGPMALAPPLLKAQTDATSAYIPGVKPPPISSPAEMMGAAATLGAMPSQIALRQAQSNLYGMQGQQAAAMVKMYQAAMHPAPAEYGGTQGSQSGDATQPGAREIPTRGPPDALIDPHRYRRAEIGQHTLVPSGSHC